MTKKCPSLSLSDAELEKVKPEFRAQVKQDAEKCIEAECSAFVNQSCVHEHSPVHHLRISSELEIGNYYPNQEMLIETDSVASVINHSEPLMTTVHGEIRKKF